MRRQRRKTGGKKSISGMKFRKLKGKSDKRVTI
jgi:hypothetical protein